MNATQAGGLHLNSTHLVRDGRTQLLPKRGIWEAEMAEPATQAAVHALHKLALIKRWSDGQHCGHTVTGGSHRVVEGLVCSDAAACEAAIASFVKHRDIFWPSSSTNLLACHHHTAQDGCHTAGSPEWEVATGAGSAVHGAPRRRDAAHDGGRQRPGAAPHRPGDQAAVQ